MFLKRRVSQLNSKVNNIVEETELAIKLLGILNKHSAHLMSTVIDVSSPEAFSEYYCQVNSSLFKYKELLTQINCELEKILLIETNKWKIKDEDKCSKIAICGNIDKDKIVTENSYHYMNIRSSSNSEKSTTNDDTYNIFKKKSELNFHFNTNLIAHSNIQPVNDLETIQKCNEQNSKIILKNDSAEIQKQIFTSLLSNFSNLQWLQNEVDVKSSRIENYKAEDMKIKEANSKVACFNKMLDLKSNIKDMQISKLPNTEYLCIMGNAISPAEFYIYLTNNESFLLLKCDKELRLLTQQFKISNNLNNLKDYLCLLKEGENSKQILSKLYALFYSEADDTLHRVKIKNQNFDEVNKVDIILIDYGLTIYNVCLDKLYLMPDHFNMYPAFATKCHLPYKTLRKSVANSNSLYLNSGLLKVFKKWIKKNQKIIVVIDEDISDQFSDSLPVKIYNSNKDECLNLVLGNYLEENEMSDLERKAEYDLSANLKDDGLEEWNPMKEDFNSNLNSYDVDIEDPAIAIYGYVGKDYERICSFYANRGVCFKGLSCRKEHVKMNPDGFTTDKEEIYRNSFKCLKMPKPNDVLNVNVTHVASATEFYCVAEKLQTNYEEETLFSLVHYMNLKCNISKMKPLLVPPSIGQVVIGKFQGDGSWYRAKVVDVAPEKDEYCLYFVDYGNTEIVSFSSIRAIEVQYLHLPFQALYCVIHGMKSSSSLSKKSFQYLQKVINKTVKIKVMSVLPGDNYQLIVKAYDQNGDEIVNDLIKKKIAIPVDDDDLILPVPAGILPG